MGLLFPLPNHGPGTRLLLNDNSSNWQCISVKDNVLNQYQCSKSIWESYSTDNLSPSMIKCILLGGGGGGGGGNNLLKEHNHWIGWFERLLKGLIHEIVTSSSTGHQSAPPPPPQKKREEEPTEKPNGQLFYLKTVDQQDKCWPHKNVTSNCLFD